MNPPQLASKDSIPIENVIYFGQKLANDVTQNKLMKKVKHNTAAVGRHTQALRTTHFYCGALNVCMCYDEITSETHTQRQTHTIHVYKKNEEEKTNKL